jgi:hypothetical protein
MSLLVCCCFARAADAKCGYSDFYGDLFTKPENRLGEVRIKLHHPNYSNPSQPLEHFVYSRLFGLLLSERLSGDKKANCRAFVAPTIYPDLWAYLSTNIPQEQAADQERCRGALGELANKELFEPKAAKRLALGEATLLEQMSSHPLGPFMEADDILKRTLRQIYSEGSLLHSLSSIDAEYYRSLDPSDFLKWLGIQRALGKIEIAEIPSCQGPDGSDTVDTTEDALPPSKTVQPTTIQVIVGSSDRVVRHALLVGLGPRSNLVTGLNLRDANQVADKYCNRENSFRLGDGPIAGVFTTRCLREVLSGTPWMVVFCDPAACTTDEEATTVIQAIAKDELVSELAKAAGSDQSPKGPYLINVKYGPR